MTSTKKGKFYEKVNNGSIAWNQSNPQTCDTFQSPLPHHKFMVSKLLT